MSGQPTRYSDEPRRGFVVKCTHTYNGGGLDYSVAVFPSKVAAQRALCDVYGDLETASRRGYAVVPIADARDLEKRQAARYAARKAEQ